MELPTLFFDEHPNPMLVFDYETLEILEVNKSAEQKYGYSRDEFRELTIEDIRPPEDIPKLHKEIEKIREQPKEMNSGTFRHQTKEGKILHVQVSSQDFPIKNRKARISHINDLSDIIKLKNEVEEAYSDQQHHIDNNPLAMVKYDENFRVVEWSKRAEEKTGYTKEEVLGTSSFKMGFFDESEADFVKERMFDIASGDKEKDRFETKVRIKNGELMEVKIHASALRNPDGDLKSVLAFIENISDQKDYQRQLEKREQKFHRLFEEANDGIFLMNDLKFIDCNGRIAEIFKGPKEEIIGKSPLDFSPEVQPDGRLSSEKAKEKIVLVNQGKPQVFEWRHKTVNGTPIDVEVSLNKIELGDDDYIQAIVRDLTEQKNIKSELEAEQKRLKQAERLAQIGWWSYEVDENLVQWSDVLYDIIGVDEQEFGATFQDFNELVHPDDRDKVEDIITKAQKTTDAIDYTLRIQKPDGELIYAKCRAQSVFNEDGELIQLSGVMQDVTSQQKDQQELKRREELFESLFLDSPVAIAMIDTEGKVQKMNKSFEDLFGYSEEELVGKDLLNHHLPEERKEEVEDIYKHVFADEGASKYYEDQRVTKSGELKDLLVGALPVKIDHEPIGAFGIYTDITKLRNTEQTLKKSLKEKEVLLSEIHHRVKNNLAIISGLLLLEAMNWDDDSAVNQVLMQSKLRIHSMAKIHEKLYESKDFANLDLEDYISDLVETISESMQIRDKDVQVEVDCDDVSLNINQALPCALIINELVTNSFKYAFQHDNNGELTVRFKRNNKQIKIVVEDNGPGLPANFENMADRSLGHRLVSQLVKQLNGGIDVATSEGAGTRYEINFQKKKKSGSASNHFV